MARISSRAAFHLDLTTRSIHAMLPRAGVFALLAAAALAACQPDSDSITGVEEVEATLDHLRCHLFVDYEITNEGEDEVVVINFNEAAGGGCSGSGAPMPVAGLSFGDSAGAHESLEVQPGCEYGGGGWCEYNYPSPTNAAFLDDVTSGYLHFDPPVSKVGFANCSSTSIPQYSIEVTMKAWDESGNVVVPTTVGPGYSLEPCAPPEDWQDFSIEAGSDTITLVRIGRTGQGRHFLDDLYFRREAQPGIECTPAQRAQTTTCSIVVPVDEVKSWTFEADSGSVVGPSFVRTDSLHDEMTWVGKAVASGMVSAVVVVDSAEHTLSGALAVSPRGASSYERFSAQNDISYDTLNVAPCPPVMEYYALFNGLAGGRNVNTPFERCGDGILDPAPIGETVETGYEHAAVTDSGPNHGLYYVQAGGWKINRGSYRNWSLDQDENTTRQSLNDNKQHKKCERANPGPAIPGLANTWEYNVLCEGNNFLSFLGAIFTHEGMGTLGTSVDQPNGHQARIEKYATSESGDPYLRVEDIVAADTAQLNFFVSDRALVAGEDIFAFSDQHDQMEPVWCNENLYLYDTGAEVYQKVLYTNDPNGPGNVVLIQCR